MPENPTEEWASSAAAAGAPGGQGPVLAPRTLFGHPAGLATLFFTELWERFSFYGMRAILILFMTATLADGGLGFDASRAAAIYGLYTAFVYLTALPGGYIADRLIGQRRAVLVGGIIIAAGHFVMAISGVASFYVGLVLIVLGTGLLKPNISTMVGELYPEGGARRDAGFSIFYMGINLGAFLSPLIVGYLGEEVDWHLGFGAAGVGMVIGLITYVAFGRLLGDAGLHPNRRTAEEREEGGSSLGIGIAVGIAALLAVLHFAGVFDLASATGLASAGGVIIVLLASGYFAYAFIAGGLNRTEKRRLVVIAVLFVFSAIFWSGFEQAGSSLNLFAERMTDRDILGWQMPASWLQSVNAVLIILLAPVFAWVWIRLSNRNREPSSPAKFSFGLVFLGLGFLVMIAASRAAANGAQVSPMWLVLVYLLHTIGELSLSPVGLSTVTKLAPHRMVGQMMGVWFMSVSLGNLMAGQVAGQFESLPLPQLFGAVAATGIVSGLILGVISRPVSKLMAGVH